MLAEPSYHPLRATERAAREAVAETVDEKARL